MNNRRRLIVSPGASAFGAPFGSFEQPTRYYRVINRKTVDAPGIKLTGELLARADRVIE